MIYPYRDVSREWIQHIKDATKLKLLEKATHGWKKPIADFIIRDVIFGDATVTDVYDIRPKTALNAGNPEHTFSTTDLTATELSEVIVSGETIADGAYVGFFGFFDASAIYGAGTGDITGIRLNRGGLTLDYWHVENIYGYDEINGYTDRPVIYSENDPISIEVNTIGGGSEQGAGLRGYICEETKKTITPYLDHEIRAMYGVKSFANLSLEKQKAEAIRGGTDPAFELSPERIMGLSQRIQKCLFQMVIDEGYAKNFKDAKEKYVIREFVCGDESDLSDFADINTANEAVAGEENWVQTAGAGETFTAAGDLLNIFESGQKIDDKKFAAFFGFADRTTTANIATLEIAPATGQGLMDLLQVQSCYTTSDWTGFNAYTMRPSYWKQNNPCVLKMSVDDISNNQNVVMKMLICEPWGDTISKQLSRR